MTSPTMSSALTPHSASRPLPWRLGNLSSLLGFVGLGGIILLVAWWGASSTAVVSKQYPWLDLGIAGTVGICTGIGAWLLAGHRAIADRRLHVTALAEAAFGDHARFSDDVISSMSHHEDVLLATAGMSHYHRPDCQLMLGKPSQPLGRAAHETHDRQPCGICQP